MEKKGSQSLVIQILPIIFGSNILGGDNTTFSDSGYYRIFWFLLKNIKVISIMTEMIRILHLQNITCVCILYKNFSISYFYIYDNIKQLFTQKGENILGEYFFNRLVSAETTALLDSILSSWMANDCEGEVLNPEWKELCIYIFLDVHIEINFRMFGEMMEHLYFAAQSSCRLKERL